MAGSQGTFEDRIGKFKAGNTLIQSWGDYDPANPLITKAGYTAFIASVEGANQNVVTKKNSTGLAKNARKTLCFTIYDDNEEIGITNPDCAEERIVRVHSYLGNLLPEDSPTTSAVHALLKKIRPNYKGATSEKSFSLDAGEEITINRVVSGELAKNTGNTALSWKDPESSNPPVTVESKQETMIITDSGKVVVKNLSNTTRGRIRPVIKTDKKLTKSPAEKTFASIPGFLNEVITLVDGLNPGTYNPPDALLTEAGLTELHALIVAANAAVATAMDAYGTGNRTRKKLYDGTGSMTKRITLTKSYLASFSGGKKSEHFIEYSQAIKGT